MTEIERFRVATISIKELAIVLNVGICKAREIARDIKEFGNMLHPNLSQPSKSRLWIKDVEAYLGITLINK